MSLLRELPARRAVQSSATRCRPAGLTGAQGARGISRAEEEEGGKDAATPLRGEYYHVLKRTRKLFIYFVIHNRKTSFLEND